MGTLSRHSFVKGAALGAAALATAPAPGSANDRIRAAVFGIRGRGTEHLDGLLAQPNVEVATMSDVDSSLFESRAKSWFDDRGLKRPRFESDMRRVFEDPDIDVVTIATPNHWHSLATIWAMQPGKDVYVEKPCSHIFSRDGNLSKQRKNTNGFASTACRFAVAPPNARPCTSSTKASSARSTWPVASVRLGRSLNFDPAKEQYVGDDEANALESRDYRAPFVVPKSV